MPETLRDWRLYLPNPSFGNPPWRNASCRVLIQRLSPFSDVQRSTPHLFLAREVRAALPDAFIDLAFLPLPQDAAALAADGLPLITGTQSRRGLREFDLVLLSNSWLLEQVNLPFLLRASGAPIWARARGSEWPPLVFGGSNASAAHALVREDGDCMADAIFFGEGERSVARIVSRWAELGGAEKRTDGKREALERIAAEVPGLWVAGSFPLAMSRAAASEPGADVGAAPILPGPEASTARLAITAGCPCLCSFCFEGHDRKPYRSVPAQEVLRRARELKAATGASTLEVESFNFNTHPGLAQILRGLHQLFHRVNLMSQRVDILATTPGLLDLELAAEKTSFTLGVEGISAGMRAFLHKSLSVKQVLKVAALLYERRTREMKLFYIITGRETQPDLEEFARFIRTLKELRERAQSAPRTVFSFGYLVRMPGTPLRHDAAPLQERAWRLIAGKAKSICETNGFEFRLALTWPEFTATQALARGGDSVHELLESLAATGPVTDAGLSEQGRRVLEEWVGAHLVELEPERPADYPFAFGFLEDESRRAFLYRQYERAEDAVDTGYARPDRERTAISAEAIASIRQLVQRKRRLKPVYRTALIPREAAGMGSEWIDSWLMRELLAAHPEQVDNVLSVREALESGLQILVGDVAWHGKTVAAVIAWDPENLGDLPSFDPAAVTSLEVRVRLPAAACEEPAQGLAEFLRNAHAPVTLVRSGDETRLVAPEKSAKKRLVRAGSCRAAQGFFELDLRIGSRPFLGEWLRSCGAARQARVEILSFTA